MARPASGGRGSSLWVAWIAARRLAISSGMAATRRLARSTYRLIHSLVAAMPEEIASRLATIHATHKELPRPPEAGRALSLTGKRT